jgi:hypothetical protein
VPGLSGPLSHYSRSFEGARCRPGPGRCRHRSPGPSCRRGSRGSGSARPWAISRALPQRRRPPLSRPSHDLVRLRVPGRQAASGPGPRHGTAQARAAAAPGSVTVTATGSVPHWHHDDWPMVHQQPGRRLNPAKMTPSRDSRQWPGPGRPSLREVTNPPGPGSAVASPGRPAGPRRHRDGPGNAAQALALSPGQPESP